VLLTMDNRSVLAYDIVPDKPDANGAARADRGDDREPSAAGRSSA
jgi:hypothetical protein